MSSSSIGLPPADRGAFRYLGFCLERGAVLCIVRRNDLQSTTVLSPNNAKGGSLGYQRWEHRVRMRAAEHDSTYAIPERMPGTFSSDEKRARHRRRARRFCERLQCLLQEVFP